MSTQFLPLEIPPGVVAKPTQNMSSSSWSEVNLVRWREGQLMPVGGQTLQSFTFASRCKAIHGWFGLDKIYYTAYLCETNLYVEASGSLYDITPLGGMAPVDFTTGGFGDGDYGAGDYGTFRTISPTALIDKLPDAFSLQNFGAFLLAMTSPDGRLLKWDPAWIGLGTPSGALAAAGAFTTASPNIAMAVNPGWVTPGMSVWNTTTAEFVGEVLTYVGTALVLTANALNNSSTAADVLEFGNAAHAVIADAGRGVVPQGQCFVVTPERFVVIFGAVDNLNGGGPRRFAWCDQENFQAWDYASVTSQAGFLDIEPASPIVTAISTRTGTLFWTAKKAYVSQFLGIPYVYNCVELADNCTPWSPQSMVTTSAQVAWMSEQGAFAYDGTSILPIQCAVRSWIDDNVDLVNVREQACMVHVENFSEVWWFFPQQFNITGSKYNTRAIIYNYRDGWWSQARMSRSAGVTASYTSHTMMADGLLAYKHEDLTQYSADAELPWAETFDLNIFGGGNLLMGQMLGGTKLTTIKQLIPDISGAAGNVRYSLFYRNSRVAMTADSNGVAFDQEQQTPKQQVRSNGYVDFRVTGRDIRLRLDLATASADGGTGQVLPVTVGRHLIDAKARGDR